MSASSLFRVDSFTVPRVAREPFLERLETIRQLLEGAEGCLQNLVLEQSTEDETARFVTIVEWRDRDAFLAAKEHVAAEYRKTGFDPQEFMRRLGVSAVMANCTPV